MGGCSGPLTAPLWHQTDALRPVPDAPLRFVSVYVPQDGLPLSACLRGSPLQRQKPPDSAADRPD